MNLKEAFRYQNFLEGMFSDASASLNNRAHALKVEKKHHVSKAIPDAEDFSEVVGSDEKFYANDDVLDFMLLLVTERKRVSEAIGKTKAGLDIDLDAAVETNKFRQQFAGSVKSMLRCTPSTKNEEGKTYRFNAIDGKQDEVKYNVEVVTTEAFDRKKAKKAMYDTIGMADVVSSMIDQAMIADEVDFGPLFNVNDSFEDAMEEYLRLREEWAEQAAEPDP